MALSLYVHIPYCIQRCRYCDFTTFEQSQIMPPTEYVELLLREIRQRQQLVSDRELRSIYFGGGTPSLIPASLIVSIMEELAKWGFYRGPNCEITLEINPATLDQEKLALYRQAGFNRFSVGAQSFSDRLLKACGREHSAQDTRETLALLNSQGLNYSFDLLFALPGQSLADLEQDILEVLDFRPPHLSAYCLTVPEGHPMSKGRPPEGEQIQMFDLIEDSLSQIGVFKYEISNFARRGFESQHNMVYWTGESFWGLGLSAHSYFSQPGWGRRFWNPKSFPQYESQLGNPVLEESSEGPWSLLPQDQREILQAHEALTDYCHISLRLKSGLSEDAVRFKWGDLAFNSVRQKLAQLEDCGWVQNHREGGWQLTRQGELLSNQVFLALTYSASDEIF